MTDSSHLPAVTPLRAINWLEATSRSLRATVPETADCADHVTERLAALLLERLPPEICGQIMSLLPRLEADAIRPLHASSRCEADASIGFSEFVERARHALGLSDLLDSPEYADSEENFERLCARVANAFLWAVAHDLPPELKSRMSEHLPSDLRSRMNLYAGFSDEAKVA